MERRAHHAVALAASRLGSTESRSDAEELVSRLLEVSRGELQLQRDRELTSDEWSRLESWVERRAGGEPVQYITGRAAFRNLDLAVNRSVLIPRPETEGLVEAVLEVLQQEKTHWTQPRVLDLGTGSGAIALAIAGEWPAATVTATDASLDALAVAQTNAASCGISGVEFVQGDWFDAIGGDDRFEVIVSNPPYIATGEWEQLPRDVREHEPHHALFSGSSGLEALREIVDLAPLHLVAHGLLALELDESRATEVASWLEGAHDWERTRLLDDLGGRPRMLLARRQSGPAIAPAQWGEER